MKRVFKAILEAVAPDFSNKVKIANLFLDSTDSYLVKTGWHRSFSTGRPCRLDGSPIPWMNYSFVNFLEGRLGNSQRLFEFGSGFSTAFYATKVLHVVSVEHDLGWYEQVAKVLPSNADLLMKSLEQGSEYEDSFLPHAHNTDIVVVDGRRRVKCCEVVFNSMKPDAVLILDDSNREKYQQAFDIGERLGFRSLRIQGLKPTGHWVEETTVFYRSTNCLRL